jgi:hypothetical protein
VGGHALVEALASELVGQEELPRQPIDAVSLGFEQFDGEGCAPDPARVPAGSVPVRMTTKTLAAERVRG